MNHCLLLSLFPVKAPTTPAVVEGVCPSDEWTEWGEYCFYLPDMSDYFIPKANWHGAIEICKRLGEGFNGNLASVHNKVTNEWILDSFSNAIHSNDGVWIGLKRDNPGRQHSLPHYAFLRCEIDLYIASYYVFNWLLFIKKIFSVSLTKHSVKIIPFCKYVVVHLWDL